MFSVLYCYVYVVKHDYLHKEQIELKCCKILAISSKHTNLNVDCNKSRMNRPWPSKSVY